MIDVRDVIVDAEYSGGHSVIRYRWRGGLVSDVGPAGQTAARVLAILARAEAEEGEPRG